MRSGVYCLTFKDGSCYVGKSIDIDRRWKEHGEKMKIGKAAKNLQAAFNDYGYPNAKVLIRCHTDHIDLMETYYICRLQPQLNAIGGIYVSDTDLPVLERHSELLERSTAEHINAIVNMQARATEYKHKYEELREYLDETKMKTKLGEELYDVHLKLQEQIEANEYAMKRIVDLEHEANKPWWEKDIFMITTNSKLMLANKNIESLHDQLKVANNDILELEEDITFIERELEAEKDMVAELNAKLRISQENFSNVDALYKELKYDKDHPWWKVW